MILCHQKRKIYWKLRRGFFYEYGFSGVGIKQIINEANVANMTLYNHFASKEELVKEVLKKREERYWSYLDSFQNDQDYSPLINLVLAHGQWLEKESPQGDMFLRAIEDFTGINSDIEVIARGHKSNLLSYLKRISAKVDSSKKR